MKKSNRINLEIHDTELRQKAKAQAALEKMDLWEFVEKALKQCLKGKK